MQNQINDSLPAPTREGTNVLIAHLQNPKLERNYGWNDQLYKLLPNATCAIRGAIDAPSGRRYIAAHLIDHGKEPLYEFKSLAYIAQQEKAGIALIAGETMNGAPDASIRYGGVWSYNEYGYIGGCGNCVSLYNDAFALNPEAPFDAKISDDRKISFGQPSNEFFPIYVREMIAHEILSQFPKTDPSFNLLEQLDYIIKYSIAVGLNSETIPNEIRPQLAQSLTWYMPYYLPIVILPDSPRSKL